MDQAFLAKAIVGHPRSRWVGKSSLLRMFRLPCKKERAPVALASGDEAKSAVDILATWADDLHVDGVKLATFGKTFKHYRAIQAKVEEQL